MAPIELTENVSFVPARKARLTMSPSRAIVSRLSVAELPRDGARSCFAHPDFLAAHGVDKVLQVRFDGAEFGPLLFVPLQNHAVFAERTLKLEASLALAAAQALMRHFALDYVLFDSVQWQDNQLASRQFALGFHFQSDWVLDRREEAKRDPVPRPIRQKWSRLLREEGEDRVAFFLEPVTDRAVFERILDWNKAQVEASGGHYLMEQSERDSLWKVARRIGLVARLQLDGQDIAGALITVCGPEAYMHCLGYDAAHARHSLGVQIIARARLALLEAKIPVLHLLWGDKRHKHDVGAVWTPLQSVLVPRSRLTLFKLSVAWVACRLAMLKIKTALRYRLDPRPGVGA